MPNRDPGLSAVPEQTQRESAMHVMMENLPRRTDQSGPRHLPGAHGSRTPYPIDWPLVSGDPHDLALLIRIKNALQALR
ncbi:hypothetical protein SAMN05421505_11559 [Sinosporangium album]|uniref:Uncharacterized protein n=1 Tax=Sinosporangium album TaxID=504805 RepID=A0A1G8C4D5_9ACTN|nr:hypothetical protein [Sinosporangium album]SDH40361.1 hypothetical protein SAMN05421505_11559 [Sinosporangium album]